VSAAADFVERFAAYWRAPSVAGLDALLAPDVRLVAPLTRTSEGLAEARRAFAAILTLVPDLSAEVHRWGPTEEGVLIDFTLTGSVGGTAISWPAIDRIVLGEDGLARERVSRFDSLPLVLAVVRSPRAWLPFARSRLSG
jgi:hypothetical protein